LKGSVRKGEHGTPIVFYKQLPECAKKDDEGNGEDERAPFVLFVLCHYKVFNVEQCDGLTLPEISQPAIAPEIDEDELCESIITGWESRPALYLNSPTEYRAYYRPSTDSVHMPARSRFVDAPHYYSTLFHELVHSTAMQATSIVPLATASEMSFIRGYHAPESFAAPTLHGVVPRRTFPS
jgi:antirestriction protein ArdC